MRLSFNKFKVFVFVFVFVILLQRLFVGRLVPLLALLLVLLFPFSFPHLSLFPSLWLPLLLLAQREFVRSKCVCALDSSRRHR